MLLLLLLLLLLLNTILESESQPAVTALVTESALEDGLAQKQRLYALRNNHDSAHFRLAVIEGQGRKKSYFYKHRVTKLVNSWFPRALVLSHLVQEMELACQGRFHYHCSF